MNIEKQLELEQRMINQGAEAYTANQRIAEQKGRGHELDYSRRLMQEFLLPLAEKLQFWLENKGPGKYGRARGLLQNVDPNKAMFIAMRAMLSSFMKEGPIVELAAKIGRMIEDDQRFCKFQETHGAYYDTIIDDFKRKGSKDYRYMQRVLTHKANELQEGWRSWTQLERVDVGTKLLDIIMTNTDLVERVDRQHKTRKITELKPTDACMAWIKEHEHVRQFMYPERAPCVIEPDPWTGIHQGGYYSPLLRQLVPMIKTKLPKEQLYNLDLTRVTDSINAVQRVPWRVNSRVLDIVRQVWQQNLGIGMPPSEKLQRPNCPVDGIKPDDMTPTQKAVFQEWKHEASAIYTAERERVSKVFQVSRIIRMAGDYHEYPRFWFVWYADFRGRLYSATAGFSPQGPDLAKGLLQFDRGLRLGERGWHWLRVHGANRYGYDKVSYEDRVRWIDDRRDALLRAADDPLSNREVWANADKPWQFLAFIFEYADAVRSGHPTEYVSRTSVGLDGSCNGLQNFSAMLRDEVGGTATNLVPGNLPSDIYARVAEVAVRKIREKVHGLQYRSEPQLDGTANTQKEYDQWAADTYFGPLWMKYEVGRKLAKRPVMTLPYGATRQSCTAYIFQSILETDRDFFGTGRAFGAACWLTPLLWASIGEVVVAAVQAMDWLQKCSSAMTAVKQPLRWTTADGFVIWQRSVEIETVKIDTQLAGRWQARVGTHTDKLDGAKQRQGVAPNFVHGNDATHLRMTVLNAVAAGIEDLMLIHDDYGTHAANTDTLHRVIRETFVHLYSTCDPIQAFAEELAAMGGDLPDPPAKGSLDINAVLSSQYFFG